MCPNVNLISSHLSHWLQSYTARFAIEDMPQKLAQHRSWTLRTHLLVCFVLKSPSLLPSLIFGATRQNFWWSQAADNCCGLSPTAAGQLLFHTPVSLSDCQTLASLWKCGFARLYERGNNLHGFCQPLLLALIVASHYCSFPHIAKHSQHYNARGILSSSLRQHCPMLALT